MKEEQWAPVKQRLEHEPAGTTEKRNVTALELGTYRNGRETKYREGRAQGANEWAVRKMNLLKSHQELLEIVLQLKPSARVVSWGAMDPYLNKMRGTSIRLQRPTILFKGFHRKGSPKLADHLIVTRKALVSHDLKLCEVPPYTGYRRNNKRLFISSEMASWACWHYILGFELHASMHTRGQMNERKMQFNTRDAARASGCVNCVFVSSVRPCACIAARSSNLNN